MFTARSHAIAMMPAPDTVVLGVSSVRGETLVSHSGSGSTPRRPSVLPGLGHDRGQLEGVNDLFTVCYQAITMTPERSTCWFMTPC